MTLVVSVRALDGVILAADSLSTMNSRLELVTEMEVDCAECKNTVRVSDVYSDARAHATCPSCTKSIAIKLEKPPAVQMSSSTMSYAQKVFPFLDTFGVAVFGSSAIGPKTIFNHMKGFERTLQTSIEDGSLAKPGVQGVAQLIRDFCETEFAKLYPDAASRASLPNVVFGLQVVGYDAVDSPTAETVELAFGSTTTTSVFTGLGLRASGDTRLNDHLAAACKGLSMQPMVEALSLQDAIDYAEFLIRTTIGVQRFANMIPLVGGDVDIALITNYSEFRWIKSKALARVLEPKYVPNMG